MLLRSSALLLSILAVPALAQSDAELTSADRVAAIIIGFSGDGTAMVHGNETANVTRDGAGKFSGTVEETGAPFSFDVVETTPCVFDATYASGDLRVTLAIDAAKIRQFTFEEREPQAGYTFFNLTLDAADGAVQTVGEDGVRRNAGGRNTIGSSLTLDELNAAATALQQACPAA